MHTPGELSTLYDQHGAQLYRYLFGVLGRREDAEDALQTVFLNVGHHLERLRDPSAYLWRAARNEVRQRHRKVARRRRREAGSEGLEMMPDSLNREVSRLQRLALAQALETLPLKQREAAVLLGFEGRSARQAGELLGVSTNTMASRYRLALDKLRKILGRTP